MSDGRHEHDELAELLAGTDAPRLLPADLRARLEASLLVGRRPDEMPPRLRRRLERSMAAATVPSARARLLAAAAAVMLVVAAVAVGVRSGSGGGDALPLAGGDRGEQAEGSGGGGQSGRGAAADGPQATDLSGDAGSGAGTGSPAPQTGSDGALTAGGTSGTAADAAPSPAAAPASGEAGAGSRAAAGPVRIGVVAGDPALEAGFSAAVRRLNDGGGAGGRAIVLVPTSAAAPAGNTLATVNLSGSALAGADGAPSWVQQPLLEEPSAAEAALLGSVVSFTSVLERQAHLAALAAFPEPAAGATAAVYHAARGPYSGRVPAAFEEALRAREVTPVRVLVADPADPRLVPATAAFLSLPRQQAGPFLAAAAEAGYRPERGSWGIESAFDEGLAAGALPDGLRVVSPYTALSAGEAEALRDATGRGLSTATVHGWVTANALAEALRRSNAGTPAEVDTALRGLTGYQTGFMPPYEVRPGTRSRTPEGIVLVPEGGRFTAVSPFLRDPL